MKEVYNRVKEKIIRRMNVITRTEINGKKLVKTIKTKVIAVAAYPTILKEMKKWGNRT